jgi:hypothetical protein
VLIYPIGIPVFFLRTLLRYKNRLLEPGVRVQLGFLYEACEPFLLNQSTDRWLSDWMLLAHDSRVSRSLAHLLF